MADDINERTKIDYYSLAPSLQAILDATISADEATEVYNRIQGMYNRMGLIILNIGNNYPSPMANNTLFLSTKNKAYEGYNDGIIFKHRLVYK